MAAVGAILFEEITFPSVKRIRFAWTSDASGNVSGIPTVEVYSGVLIALATVPSGAPDAPSAYTIAILDDNGIDILAGAGTARSTTLTEYIKAPQGAVANHHLSLLIAGAGNAKKGTAYLYLR